MSSEPDDLYTLRAQYWLGHYALCLTEAKSIARKNMSADLKEEREEFMQRSQLALGDEIEGGETGALQALVLKQKYQKAATEDEKNELVDQMKSIATMNDSFPSVQLYASQLYLEHGSTKEALACLGNSTMEHISMALQIYLKLDRIDLANKALDMLKKQDEDAILTSLGAVLIALAGGASTASDASHYLNSLSEQYGPSPLLMNLSACAYLILADYEEAETKLLECKKEFAAAPDADTLCNLIVCAQYQGKEYAEYLAELVEAFPNHAFVSSLNRVTGAFEREAVKYKSATTAV